MTVTKIIENHSAIDKAPSGIRLPSINSIEKLSKVPTLIEIVTEVLPKDKEENKIIDRKNITVIPDVYKTQGSHVYSNCTGYSETTCLCTSIDDMTVAKRSIYLERRNWITTERLCELRKKAQDALKQHKTFTIRGCFYSIRKSLVNRGWIEKLDIHRRAPVNGSCQVIMEDLAQNLPQRRPGETRRQHNQKCERSVMSRFLEHMPIDFLWSARKEKTDWIDMSRNPYLMINKLHKSPFTTKEGLCSIFKDLHWFFEEGISETYYPRSYNVWNLEELEEFCDDYRLTACISMLRLIVEATTSAEANISLYSVEGQVPTSSVRFAMKQCKSFLRSKLHFDIDEDDERIWEHDWEIFLLHYQMLAIENAGLQQLDDNLQWKILLAEVKQVFNEINTYWPQSALDGVRNIWIVKPSNRCRGRGIHLMNDLRKIVTYVNPPVVNKGRYVVQKYIERPLIIHNCKFDIRQWFLVTSVQPMVIWMYKESYLRFSSQEYDLVNFHESVHLTNYAVQKRYTNGTRDERLPRENMWDCYSFQAYLRQIDKAEMWTERIYPGMQKAFIGTMLASQDSMDRRPNSFELFGADFMISEDFQPWLIEINSSPDLGASTSVTARLCPQCLEDIIKVVVDYRNDPKASTGNFELIYRQNIPPAPAYLGLNLCLKGTQIVIKNGGVRKERIKIDSQKTKPSRRLSHPISNTLISPRPLVIDFTEDISSSQKLKSLSVQRKLNNSISPRTRDTQKQTKSSIKPINSSRRYASCGPRIIPPIQKPPNEIELSTNEVNDNKTHIKCIGSKFASDSTSSSPRKSSTDTPRHQQNSRACLKPLNAFAQTSAKVVDSVIKEKSYGKLSASSPSNIKEYRKYLAENKIKLSKSTSKLSAVDRNHLYAIGLSLRAWRSKYNRLAKSSIELGPKPHTKQVGTLRNKKKDTKKL